MDGYDEARKRVIELLDEKVRLYKLIRQCKEAMTKFIKRGSMDDLENAGYAIEDALAAIEKELG